jgi:transcriptional regulatory protein RtcR
LWSGNFRELSASITRMATLADSGRIDEALVEEEIGRLRRSWGATQTQSALDRLLGEAGAEALDLFDRLQLEAVVDVCRQARSLSDAGRQLFAVSRQEKQNPNDADRLRKYLARFGLDWSGITDGVR